MVFAPGSVTVLDGGLATQLEAQGYDLGDALWSARLVVDDPEAIVAAHLAYFSAGADLATTASYQASFPGFAARGIERAEAARLLRRSVELADRARAAAVGGPRWVAASVGPYGAALADGSEYRGRYGLTVAELAAWHRPRLDVLVDAGPDVLALETVPDVDEALALATALAGSPVPAWLSYSVRGACTRAGQPLADAFAAVADVPEIVAVGVNCCAPADVGPAITAARAVTGKPVVVYPNSGERWDAGRHRWTGPGCFRPEQAVEWVARGAAGVGGCCRVDPDAVAGVARAVRGSLGHQMSESGPGRPPMPGSRAHPCCSIPGRPR